MSFNTLTVHRDNQDAAAAEQAARSYEHDIGMELIIDSAFTELADRATQEYTATEQNFTDVVAALPDLNTLRPDSMDHTTATWHLTGVVPHGEHQYDVQYDITAQSENSTGDTQSYHQKIAGIVGDMRRQRIDQGLPLHMYGFNGMTDRQIAAYERNNIRTYMHDALITLRERQSDRTLYREVRRKAKDCATELAGLDYTDQMLATRVLEILERYEYAPQSIATILADSDNGIKAGGAAYDKLLQLREIEQLHAQQLAQGSIALSGDTYQITIMASLSDNGHHIGSQHAVFGSNLPYLTRLYNLQHTDPNSVQAITATTRTNAFLAMQHSIVRGELPDTHPGMVALANSRLQGPEQVSNDAIAGEVNDYDAFYVQQHAINAITAAIGPAAEHLATVASDTDIDALAAQQEMLRGIRATNFSNSAPTSAVPA